MTTHAPVAPAAPAVPPVPEGLTIVHKLDGEPYRYWCCPAGVRRAARWGATAIDVDVNLSRERVVIATHWQRPLLKDKFIDPEGRIGKYRRVSSLTLEQIDRLVSPEGFRIRPVHVLMRAAARRGVTLCLEAKIDERFGDVDVWESVAADAARTGASVIVMAQPHKGQGIAALAAAQDAGLPTMLLSRGVPKPGQWQYLTYVKGPRRWTEPGRPPEVLVVGGHPGIATRWGSSCMATPTSIQEAKRAVARAAARANR